MRNSGLPGLRGEVPAACHGDAIRMTRTGWKPHSRPAAREWAGSTRNECSVFAIGRIMLCRLKIAVSQAVAAIIASTEEVSPNRG